MLDYRKDLLVDMNNLLKEWNEHSQKFMDYAEAAADAEEEKNLAKQEVGIIRSDLAKNMRRRPRKYGIRETTVSGVNNAIKEAIDSHSDVVAAERRYYSAVKNETIVSKAEHAMGSYRRTALERVVDLILRGYVGPKMKLSPDEVMKARDFRRRKSRMIINELNKPKKKVIRRN